MKTHLNTLFVTLEGAYLRKDGAAVEIRHEGETKLRVPLHNLDGIAAFGWDITASASLMYACAEANVALTFHNPYGTFLASSHGPIGGNVLLRRAQYRAADNESHSVAIARNLIAAKIANTRTLLQRAARDHGEKAPDSAADLRARPISCRSASSCFPGPKRSIPSGESRATRPSHTSRSSTGLSRCPTPARCN